MRKRYRMSVSIASAGSQMNDAYEVITAYGTAVSHTACVYPVEDKYTEREYGLHPETTRRMILPRGSVIAPGDGVWLEEAYTAGGQNPPWRVRSVWRWPNHVEAIVQKTGFSQ